jgi:hypothetical protein
MDSHIIIFWITANDWTIIRVYLCIKVDEYTGAMQNGKVNSGK